MQIADSRALGHAWPPDRPSLLVLGPVAVVYQGMISHIGGQKLQTVLGLLLEARGSLVSVDRLVDGLWPDVPPPSARGTLHSYLSNIRRLVGDDLSREGDGYRIEVTPETFDALRFEELARQGREWISADPGGGAAVIRSALQLWRGVPYSGLSNCPALMDASSRLTETRLGLLEDCIEAELRAGAASSLIPELEMLVAEHPFRERLVGSLMEALSRVGRRTEAIAVYERVRAALAAEFQMEPGPKLKEQARQISE